MMKKIFASVLMFIMLLLNGSVYANENLLFDTQQPRYVFEDYDDSNVLKGSVVKIPKGTSINAYLQHPINTAVANEGDSVNAILQDNWYYKKSLIAPQGSVLFGHLTKANSASYGSSNGYVQIEFNKLITLDGQEYELLSEKIDFKVTNDGKVTASVKKVAKWAVAGAAIGAIAAMMFSNGDGSDIAKGALIGAGSLAGGALIGAVAEKGVDAEIPSYTEIQVVLENPLNVVVTF